MENKEKFKEYHSQLNKIIKMWIKDKNDADILDEMVDLRSKLHKETY